MPGAIVRKLTPEQEELDRKRQELTAVRAALAERELELADLRAQLKSFEGRYLRQVGVLYAELDNWEAKVADLKHRSGLRHRLSKTPRQARKRAEETHEATHGEASKVQDFRPSDDLGAFSGMSPNGSIRTSPKTMRTDQRRTHSWLKRTRPIAGAIPRPYREFSTTTMSPANPCWAKALAPN